MFKFLEVVYFILAAKKSCINFGFLKSNEKKVYLYNLKTVFYMFVEE